jgi:uncharacterized protein (DUF433 family)
MLQVPDQKVPLSAEPDGALFVTGTWVSLHSLVGMFEEGASPEEIAYECDSLELPDVYSVLAYYLRNRDAVKAELRTLENRSEEVAERFENSFPESLRAKLPERKSRGG